MSTVKKDANKPSELTAGGAATGKPKKVLVNAINSGKVDDMLDAHDAQHAIIHPPDSGTASATANTSTASGTPNVGTASGTPSLND